MAGSPHFHAESQILRGIYRTGGSVDSLRKPSKETTLLGSHGYLPLLGSKYCNKEELYRLIT